MEFNEKCYAAIRRVPKGRVVTYKQVAKAVGCKAYRAVGSAMRNNFDASIPCHRVVKSDGSMGNYNRGVALKEKLLKSEGVVVVGGRIDLQKFSYTLSK